MTKKDAKPNFSSFTKAELIRTIKTLSARETKHLNRIANLERVAADAGKLVAALDGAPLLRASDSRCIWMHDLDGTGSMHPCAAGDPGAVGFVPLSPQLLDTERKTAAGARTGRSPRNVANDVAAVAGSNEHPRNVTDLLERDREAFGGFPWEQDK